MTSKQKSYLYAFFALVEFAGGIYNLITDQYVIGIAFLVVAIAFTIRSVEFRLENRNPK
jgi:hypothetical protein